MSKTRVRDEKFRLLLVRIHKPQAEELQKAAEELGLDSTKFIRREIYKVLATRKGSVEP